MYSNHRYQYSDCPYEEAGGDCPFCHLAVGKVAAIRLGEMVKAKSARSRPASPEASGSPDDTLDRTLEVLNNVPTFIKDDTLDGTPGVLEGFIEDRFKSMRIKTVDSSFLSTHSYYTS